MYEAVHQMKSFPEHGTECQKPFISSGFAVCPPIQISDDHRAGLQIAVFYLGYIWGLEASPSFPLPKKKTVLSLQYLSNYIGKIIQTRRDQYMKQVFPV